MGINYSEWLVGSIAVALALIAAAISVGPWSAPYQLASISAVAQRFGKPAARLMWLGMALASLTAGLAILADVRPSYAVDANRSRVPHGRPGN